MYLVEKARNILRSLLQTYGPRSVKSSLWNIEFLQNRWDCLNDTSNDFLYPYLDKYANNGSILDLGCGTGNTGSELSANVYRDYTGVDISDVAIDKAIKRALENGRTDRNRYLKSDIFSYEPTQLFDIILFRDSIYYIPRPKIKSMLLRFSKCLKEGGVLIVRIWDGGHKYKPILDIIENNFEVVEKYQSDQQPTVIIVFR
jgi:SAM-dependent methyltransferase